MVKYLRAVDIAEGRSDFLPPPPPPPPSAPSPSMTDERKPELQPPPPPPPCARVGCGELGSLNKRCGKCLVACYCSVEWQREGGPVHKKQCKPNRRFELREQTEEVKAREELSDGRERPLGILMSVPWTLRTSLTPSTQPHLRRHMPIQEHGSIRRRFVRCEEVV